MPKAPHVSATQLVKALEKAGFVKQSQRGSHIKLKHPDGRTTTVPNHREIKPGTLSKGILKPLGISLDDLRSLL